MAFGHYGEYKMSSLQFDGFHRLPTATLRKLLDKQLRKASNSTYVPTARMRTIGTLRMVLRTRGVKV
jgi:hypothetical protein